MIRRAGFARNVLVLAGGAAGAQLINAIASPFLTRLYSAPEIGQFGLFLSFMSLAVVTVSLRYEQAVVLPATPGTAVRVLALAIGLVPLVGLTCVALLAGLVAFDVAGFGSLDPIAIPIAFVGLVGFGATAALRSWYLREGGFRPVSEVLLIQSVTRAVGQVAAGLLGLGVGALLLFDALARGSGIHRLARGARDDIRDAWGAPGPRIVSLARTYWRFPLLGVPSSLLNTAAQALTVPVLAATYGLEVAGWMALVQRVLGVPLMVVGASVGDALLARAAELVRSSTSSLSPVVYRIILGLAALAIPMAAILALAGPTLFALIFGEPWRDAGVIAAIMAPWLAAALVVSPLSRIAQVYQGQAQKLIYDVLALAAVVGGFLYAFDAGLDPFQAVALVTGLQVAVYAIYLIILLRMVARGSPDVDRAI